MLHACEDDSLILRNGQARLPFPTDPVTRGAPIAFYAGARPAELPVQFPQMVVNLKIAKALGLAVPQSVLLRV